MRLPGLLIFVTANAISPSVVDARVWTTMARTDGIAVRCRTASTQAVLDSLLTAAGWSMYGNRRPVVDFATEFAAIVAPGKFQANSDLKLVSQTVEGETRIIRWRFTVRAEQRSQQEGVSDFSSLAEPGNEILVVTFPKSALNLKQSCIGPY